MALINRPLQYGALLALLGGMLSCGTPRTRAVRAFVPPRPAAPQFTSAPPDIEAREDVTSDARMLPLVETTAETRRAEAVIREADLHFQTGRKLYQQGEDAGARAEFDRSLDVLLSSTESPGARAAIDRRIEELVDAIHRLDLAGLGAAEVVSTQGFEKPPLEDMPELTFPVDPKLKNKVAEELKATASQLPLETSDEVLSYIHYFSSERGRKVLLSGLRRSGRYRPLIQRVFDEEGIPQELIYLAQVESGFLPRAVSRKSATGMWQFMLESGRLYGLQQTAYSDDRLDPEKSTRAAAKHLRDLYNRYGDWYLAIAAYNCGPGVIDRAVERTGYADFWELLRRHTMPRDTVNYVPAILAITIIVKNAAEYGIDNLEFDPPLEYDTVEMAAPTHLQLVADLTDIPVPELAALNPQLLKGIAPGHGGLRVPRGIGTALAAALEPVPEDKRATWRAHRVGDGESIAALGQRYRVTAASIASANHLSSGALEPGSIMLIPTPAPRLRATARAAGRRGATHTAAHSKKTVLTATRSSKTPQYSAANVSTSRKRSSAGH